MKGYLTLHCPECDAEIAVHINDIEVRHPNAMGIETPGHGHSGAHPRLEHKATELGLSQELAEGADYREYSEADK